MNRSLLLFVAIATQACLGLPAAMAQSAPLSGDAPSAKVGDSWRWTRSDRRTGIQNLETKRTLTAVSAERIEGTENEGPVVMTGDMSVLETADWVRPSAPRFYDYPLAVGKKWSFKFVQNGKTSRYSVRWQYDAEVVAQETIKVPAGEFTAFKVAYKGFWNNDTSNRSGRGTLTNWYAPAARATVRTEFDNGSDNNLTELVEYKLQP